MEEKGIPIFWGDDNNLETHYINQMFISHTGGEFYITFGELAPFAMNENMKIPDEVNVKPIFRIALTAENMKSFLDVMISNYKKFEDKKK
jgi:hypothetical protein